MFGIWNTYLNTWFYSKLSMFGILSGQIPGFMVQVTHTDSPDILNQ